MSDLEPQSDATVLALAGLGLVAALVAALIALNKVGSPQYITWLAAPVVLGLITDTRRFIAPAMMTAAAALLTQLIYPWRYDDVLGTTLPMLVVLTVRDVLELALLIWPAIRLIKAGRRPLQVEAAAPANSRGAILPGGVTSPSGFVCGAATPPGRGALRPFLV